MVVGRWAGDNSLAAVGSNSALIGLLTNLFVGLAVGANTMAAKCYGAHDRDELHRVVHTSILLSIISGLVLTVVGVFGARTLSLIHISAWNSIRQVLTPSAWPSTAVRRISP